MFSVTPSDVSNIRVVKDGQDKNCRFVVWDKEDIGKCIMSYVVLQTNESSTRNFTISRESFKSCSLTPNTYYTIQAVYKRKKGNISKKIYLQNVTLTEKGM